MHGISRDVLARACLADESERDLRAREAIRSIRDVVVRSMTCAKYAA